MRYNSPVAGPHSTWGRYPSGGVHRALDYAVPTGTYLRCAGPGKVTVAGWSTTGFGYHIRVQLDDGNTVIYGHLLKGSLRVSAGQRVQRNQILAKTNNTGNSTGPHLHMEVRKYSYVPLSAWDFTSYLDPYKPGPVTWTGL